MNEHMRTIIIGAGGQGKIYAEILERNGFNLIGYVSSEPKGTVINGYSVLCNIDELVDNKNEILAEAVIVAIGDNIIRSKIIDKISKLNLKNINAIHPTAIISKYTIIGEGIYIAAGSIISPGAIVNDFVSIGINSSIGHDSVLGRYVNIAPGVTIAGKVTFNEFSVAGLGAKIIEKINIGKSSIIGAGAVVVKDVEPDSVMVGIPAKLLKYRDINVSYLK